MTVSAVGFSGPTWVQNPGNGAATVFSVPFLITAATDLLVGFITGGVYTLQTSGYSVSGIASAGGAASGIQVTFAIAPPAGTTVDLRSAIPETQVTNFANLGGYYPQSTTNALDRAVRNIADLYRLTYQFGIHGPDAENTPWPALPNAAARANTVQIYDANGLPSVGAIPSTVFTQALFNFFLQTSPGAYFAPTAAELATGVTILSTGVPVNNALRYFIANTSSAAATNTANAVALFNPAIPSGPTGDFTFPNNGSGTPDAYSFSGVIPMRAGIHIDGQNCDINSTGAAGPNDANSGLFFVLNDFSCKNVTFNMAVDTTAAVNSGQAIQIGVKGGGFYFTVFDSLLPVPLGNIDISDCRFNMNNTGPNVQAAIQGFGGIVNLRTNNLVINGGGTLFFGIYYEYGWATMPGTTPGSQTSHAHNLRFNNTKVTNLLMTGSNGGGIVLTGAYSATVDGLYVNGANNGFVYSPGSALFFNPWVGVDDIGAKRSTTVNNVVAENITTVAMILSGAGSASGGYLAGAGLTPSQQSDLMSFSVDGFALNAAGNGMQISGNATVRNGTMNGPAGSGQLEITDDCMEGTFINVNVRNGIANGVRGGFASVAGWSPARQKSLVFINCRVQGNATQGYTFANTRSVKILGGRIGYNVLNDGVNETTQNPAILAASANGVIAEGVFVTVAGDNGATGSYTTNFAYQTSGTSSGCGIVNPLGNVTTFGRWDVDGTAEDNSTNIATAAATINQTNKYPGRRCFDTSNQYRLLIAQGSAPTSPWVVSNTAIIVTPA